jgi:hypothetical protein
VGPVPLVENRRDALFEGFGAGRVGVGVGKTPPPGNSSTWVVDFEERAIVVADGQREMGRTGYSTPTGQRGVTCTMCMA